MFQIDDDFLSSIGYDPKVLSDDQKERYKKEIIDELIARTSEEIAKELDEDQANELNDIQENPSRAYSWLNEFHSGYKEDENFKGLASVADDEAEAVTFYAVGLWLNDAVPRYGEIMREQMADYQAELVRKRELVNRSLGF